MRVLVLSILTLSTILGCANSQRALGHPPFLEGAPKAVIDEFHQLILANPHLTDSQMHHEVEMWIKKQSKPIQRKYADFEISLAQAIQQHNIAHQWAIASFSPAAKKADARLHELINDPHLSVKEKHEKTEAFYSSLPSKVRDEIERAMRGGQ